MTCIIAIKESSGAVYLGGDRLASNSSMKQVYKLPKVFMVGDFYFGTCGSFYMSQLLRHEWDPPERPIDATDDSYIFRDVRKSLMRMFEDNHYGELKEDTDNEPNFGNFIMVYKGRIFEVQANMALLEVDKIASIGSGLETALGAVGALEYCMGIDGHAKEIIRIAMGIVSRSVLTVSGECDVILCR